MNAVPRVASDGVSAMPCLPRFTVLVLVLTLLGAVGCAAPRPRQGTSTGLPYRPTAPFEPASVEVPRAPRPAQLGPVSSGGSVPAGQRSTATDWRAGAARWLGAPYRTGGSSRDGMDCSGLAQVMYRDLVGISIPRTTVALWSGGQVVSAGELRPGDLVFFSRSATGDGVSHVGVAVGDGEFVHASTLRGVRYDMLASRHWQERWMGARRWAR